MDDPSLSNASGYVSNTSNWSTDQVPVDINDLLCDDGSYQACAIITPIADVDATSHKMKGSISEAHSTSSGFYLVSGYTPTTGTANYSNRQQ
ncbi:MAG: hypothetical protein J7497_13820 [Chitinophagaceae bacterium]|nr:hypothetical protein [Chitinophagaceae bacterium]